MDIEKVLTEYKPMLMKVCFMFKHDIHSQMDLFQDISFNLWKGLETFNNQAKLSTWIYRVALNTALSSSRREKNNPLFKAAEFDDQVDDNFNENYERNHDLMKLVKTLSPANKALILLFFDGKSYKEIGEIIGITEKNASVKILRIKRKLEDHFQKISKPGEKND